MSKEPYHGVDIKSLALNLASCVFFFAPFAAYFDKQREATFYLGVCGVSFFLAYIIPPIGWMRPHPYSDLPGNKPLRFKSS
mmetsp:Transcript_6892/g.10528  ORF Transcript_6892/g.10528 Transcript_6892/m.10528 type:complete len:81 (-) Transcript_6892:120-362(-)